MIFQGLCKGSKIIATGNSVRSVHAVAHLYPLQQHGIPCTGQMLVSTNKCCNSYFTARCPAASSHSLTFKEVYLFTQFNVQQEALTEQSCSDVATLHYHPLCSIDQILSNTSESKDILRVSFLSFPSEDLQSLDATVVILALVATFQNI